jgi:hypothetical protein
MPELNSATEFDRYDITMNVIGGLSDCSVIYKAIDSFFSREDSNRDLASHRNEFDLRTERSRTRVELAVRRSFLQFYNQDHKDLIQTIFQSNMTLPERELILFWQFALNNRLFREISSRVYIRAYLSGRAGLSKDDITAYLKEFLSQNKELNLKWSESTINTLSTKYLNLMTKFNFMEGKRIKSFKPIRPTAEALCLFLYFAKLYDPLSNNILKNEMLPLSFIVIEDIRDRLKKLSLKGFFNMDFNGVALNIELTHSYKGICDVLYNKP